MRHYGSGLSCCPDCGKVRYLSKAKAKEAIRQHRHRAGRLNAYRCGDFWHIGHLPAAVKRGLAGRDALGGGGRS